MSALTIAACPAASTEVDVNLRTAYDLTEASAIRVQVEVVTPVDGAKITLKYSADSGVTWANASRIGTGPFVACDVAGSFQGGYLNLADGAKGDVLLSPFVSGGDGATDLVLGNLSALVYVKTEEGGEEVIVEELPACLLPGSVMWGTDFDFADVAALDAYSATLTDPYWFRSGTPSAIVIDAGTPFAGAPVLRITDFWECYFTAGPGGGPYDDVTAMVRFNMPVFDATPVDSGGFLLMDLYGYYNYFALAILNDDLVVETSTSNVDGSPSTLATVGLASDVLGQDIEIIGRWKRIDDATVKVQFYSCAPCETPVLLWESDTLPSHNPGASDDGSRLDAMDFFQGYGSTYVTPNTGDLVVYQFAIDTDPTVFGIPA